MSNFSAARGSNSFLASQDAVRLTIVVGFPCIAYHDIPDVSPDESTWIVAVLYAFLTIRKVTTASEQSFLLFHPMLSTPP
jgi:hypothetical protein